MDTAYMSSIPHHASEPSASYMDIQHTCQAFPTMLLSPLLACFSVAVCKSHLAIRSQRQSLGEGCQGLSTCKREPRRRNSSTDHGGKPFARLFRYPSQDNIGPAPAQADSAHSELGPPINHYSGQSDEGDPSTEDPSFQGREIACVY